MKKVIVLMLCFSLLMPAFSLFAAEAVKTGGSSAADKLCSAAKKDATKDFEQNSFMWNVIGCVVGPLALLAPQFMPPAVPMARMSGKSSQYVQVYSSCYVEQGKTEQFNAAMLGCGIGVGAYALISIIYFVFVVNMFNQAANAAMS